MCKYYDKALVFEIFAVRIELYGELRSERINVVEGRLSELWSPSILALVASAPANAYTHHEWLDQFSYLSYHLHQVESNDGTTSRSSTKQVGHRR